MKKLVYIIITLLFITGCSFSNKEITEVNFDDYIQKIENKESFVLYIGSANCSHCSSFRPKLDKVVSKYALDIYYLDISKIENEQYEKLKNKVFLTGTPTIVFIKDGSYSGDKLVGDKDLDNIVDYFKSIEYIGD